MNIDEFIEHTQETARKHRYHADFFDINNPMRVACIKSAEDCEQLAEWLEKSKEYQHLEEQGRLVKLPVKDDTAAHRECVPIKSTCYHENYKCSECPLTELFCDEFYKAIDRCREEAYTSGCLAGMDLAKSEADKISTSPYYDGYSKALDDLLNSLPDCDYVGIERLVCLVEQLKREAEKMKVVIDIPNDFTGDYIADKFKDFFSRVIADIDCKGMCGRYEKEIAEMFLKAFDDSEEKISCNCQHNSNSRDNEPCCRCDSRKTNADRIRNMSDEEMAERIASSPNFNCADYCDSFSDGCAFRCNRKERELAVTLKWLQSEAE